VRVAGYVGEKAGQQVEIGSLHRIFSQWVVGRLVEPALLYQP